MAIEPTAFVRQYAPWSTSKADTVRNCPRKFKYQYIDKIRGLKAKKLGDALVGKAVHKLLEYSLVLKRPISDFVDTVIAEYDLNEENTARFMGNIPAATSLMERMNAYCQRKWNNPTPKIEQKLAVNLEGKGVAFFDDSKAFFRGVVDLSYRIPGTQHMVILDHKTGKDRGIGYYQSQFDGYLWLLKGAYPELEGVQIAVNFLQSNKTEFATFKYVHDAGELRDHVVAFLNKATAKVVDIEAVRRGPLCDWCDFYSICPAHNTDGGHGEEISNEGGEGSDPQ